MTAGQKTKTGIILAAGAGKRLSKFETIKPLVKVGGKPLVISSIERLQEAGVRKIYIVAGSGQGLIERELLAYPNITASIEFVQQRPERNSMVGSMLSLEGSVSGSFFVMACDLIFEKNPLNLFYGANRAENALAVLVSDSKVCNLFSGARGRIAFDGAKIMDKGAGRNLSHCLEAGIYHFSGRAFNDFLEIAKEHYYKRSVNSVLPLFAKEHAVVPVFMKGTRWFDINTPSTLIRAELFFRERNEGVSAAPPPSRFLKPKTNVPFNHSKNISFDVHIERGVISNLDKYEIIPHELYQSPHYIIVDENIDKLYGKRIHEGLAASGFRAHKILVDSGEWSKSIKNFTHLANRILSEGIDKKSTIISVGGGVVKDLAGFLASTLYRGIGFISIPTTLLSQCDAAIALKQGVNGEGGKNLIGSFYAPLKVIVDPELLLTLDERYVRDGLAECIKQSLAQDKQLFRLLDAYKGPVKDIHFLEQVVKRSVALKISSIQDDFNEEHKALVNQYGHEVGHAVEYLSGYMLGHGESVAVGMRVSAEIAQLLGISDEAVKHSHARLLKKFQLPYTVPGDIKPDDIVDTLRYHKKFHSGESRFVLVRRVGSLWKEKNMHTFPVPLPVLKEALARSYED